MRTIGFDKEPLKFKATGQLDAPNLIVEYNEELHFDVAIGDMISDETVCSIFYYIIYKFLDLAKIHF